MYRLTEIFGSYQGEGAQTGRRTVFVRFAGCNYWSGSEEGRERAVCKFCDTDFSPRYNFNDIPSLTAAIEEKLDGAKYVVLTGGEPLLQFTPKDLEHLRSILPDDIEYGIETNGSVECGLWPTDVWVTMSPKAHGEVSLKHYNELKVVLPGDWKTPEQILAMFSSISNRVTSRLVVPEDGGNINRFWSMAREITTKDPRWRVGIQAHKFWEIP